MSVDKNKIHERPVVDIDNLTGDKIHDRDTIIKLLSLEFNILPTYAEQLLIKLFSKE